MTRASRPALAAILALVAGASPGCASSRVDNAPAGDARPPAHDTSNGWSGEASANVPAPPPPSAVAEPEPARGKSFAEEVRLLHRIAACGGEDALPAGVDARIVKAHCDDLARRIEIYKARWLGPAAPFLKGLLPAGVPAQVVYPFAGGDLLTALATYADAREITTLSLELAGDPRRIHGMSADALERSLARLRAHVSELLVGEEYSRSETLKKTQRGDIPGELGFFLVALVVHGQVPVDLRYFKLDRDGAVRYLTAEDIDAADRTVASHRKATWTPPDFSEAFANVEISFRPRGAAADAPLRIHRHVAANLADEPLSHNPELMRHLEKKGRVAAMTKAASYLLWNDGFSTIRSYLIQNLEFMISDSTGVPPKLASRAGLSQETYGNFKGSLLRASLDINADFRKLWDGQPKRKLPVRYGYLDTTKQAHLLVTRRPAAP